MGGRFQSTRNLSIEDFKSQFKDETEEVLIKIQWSWEKGNSKPEEKDGYVLNHINYTCPWTADKKAPFGHGGQMYWYGKKKIFGYPYPPRFKRNSYYYVRVRRCRFEDQPGFLYLEEVLDKNVDPEKNTALYEKVYNEYTSEFESSTEEILFYSELDRTTAGAKGKIKGVIGRVMAPVLVSDGDSVKQATLQIPFDSFNFKNNSGVSLKAGTIYRAKVKAASNNNTSRKSYMLISVEGKDSDTSLKEEGDRITSLYSHPAPDMNDGDFLVSRRDGISESSAEVLWPAPGNPEAKATIHLECTDNPMAATTTREQYLAILSRKENWDRAIYDLIVSECSNADGVGIWGNGDDEGERTIPEDEFRHRLEISVISIDSEGVTTVWIELDEMFTDHCYWIDVNPDGTLNSHGLLG